MPSSLDSGPANVVGRSSYRGVITSMDATTRSVRTSDEVTGYADVL